MPSEQPSDLENRLNALRMIDPSIRLRYLDWLRKIEPSLDTVHRKALAIECLIEFHGVSEQMSDHERDIYRYASIDGLSETLVKYRGTRVKPSMPYLSQLEADDVIERTTVLMVDGLAMLKPRSIEDVIVLTQNEELLSSTGEGLYETLIGLGEVYVFISGAGVHVGARPMIPGNKGILFDCFGELAVFEDILACHPSLGWNNAKGILSVMIHIDPCLPFDLAFEDVETYVVALEQFELVLHEDREIPEHLVEALQEINPAWISM